MYLMERETAMGYVCTGKNGFVSIRILVVMGFITSVKLSVAANYSNKS